MFLEVSFRRVNHMTRATMRVSRDVWSILESWPLIYKRRRKKQKRLFTDQISVCEYKYVVKIMFGSLSVIFEFMNVAVI